MSIQGEVFAQSPRDRESLNRRRPRLLREASTAFRIAGEPPDPLRKLSLVARRKQKALLFILQEFRYSANGARNHR